MTAPEKINAPLPDTLPPEAALRAFLRVSPLVGQEFFNALVLELADCLHVRYCFVGELADPASGIVHSVAARSEQGLIPNFSYSLTGTPCEYVIGHSMCVHESDIQALFPQDTLLVDMQAESYVGIPLFSSKKSPIGLVVVMHDQPLHNRPDVPATVTLFAARAAAELERLQTQAQLIRNEARYRSVISSLVEGILIYRRDGTLLNCNPSACDILGISEEQLMQTTFHDNSWKVFHPSGDPIPLSELPVQISLRTGKPVRGSILGVETPHRGIRWLNVYSTPVSHTHPDAVDLVTISFTDITDQRQSESALRLSEERFRTLIQHSPDAIVVIDAETMKFVDHNPQAQKLFLMSGHELSQCGPIEVSPPLQPDGMPSSDKAMVVIQSAARGKNIIFEWLLRRKTGENILCEFRLIRLPSPDRTLLRGSITDITERRRSQERFRVMAEQTGQLVYEYDIKSEEIVWSGAIYRVTGYPPEDFQSMNIQRWSESIHPEDREHAVQTLEHVIRHGNRYDVAYRFLRRDGVWIHIEDHGVVLREESGQPTIMLGTMNDVTNQKRREEATRTLENQLRQSQKMEAVGTLAGGIAHDFNNILGAIIGYTELASMESPENGEIQSLLSEVLKASHRAKDLVRQILTFSRRQQPDRVPLNLADCIHESVRLLRATLPVSIQLVTRMESQPIVLGDSSQIQQVLINLATNAAQAMPNRPGTLTITLRDREVESHRPPGVLPGLQPGPYAELEFNDNGEGMDPTTLKRIFEPFFTTKKPGEGTGLGLAVVHGIINDHRGEIEVDSTPGVGTTFRIYIPVCQESQSAENKIIPPAQMGQGQRIIVVDDEVDLTHVVKKILDRLGYRGSIYNDPLEALACIKAEPGAFQLMLADLSMPGMTGIELAHAVHEHDPDLPFLLITGYGGDLTPEQVAQHGIRAIVSKPVSFRLLSELVHEHLRTP